MSDEEQIIQEQVSDADNVQDAQIKKFRTNHDLSGQQEIKEVSNSSGSSKILSAVCFIIALAFITIGFYTMFHYGDGVFDTAGHIVGGDAYNYIIIGIRGLGFIVTGLVFSVLGSALLLYTRFFKWESERY